MTKSMKPYVGVPLLSAILAFTVHPVTCRSFVASLFQRECSERCGFLGLAFVVHDGTPGSDSCTESCIFLPSMFERRECGRCDASSFDIQLDFSGIPSSDQSFFTDAKARWESIITSDVSSRRQRGPTGVSGCTYPGLIDDLYICATYSDIDGPRGVLGSAGPAFLREQGNDVGLPLTGFMQFDSADIESLKSKGGFAEVIRHEMAHVLGIGTVWDVRGVTGSDAEKCPYSGPRANAEYEAISGCPIVPTETDGGPGTACGHWDEQCLRDELMTGRLNTTAPLSPLSRITIATLDDLGYTVDYSSAEPFGIDNLGPGCDCNQSSVRNMIRRVPRQLGGSNGSGARRRQLSARGRQVATEYGRAILLERSRVYAKERSDPKVAESSDKSLYVGDQVVCVFFEENEKIYDVVVRRE